MTLNPTEGVDGAFPTTVLSRNRPVDSGAAGSFRERANVSAGRSIGRLSPLRSSLGLRRAVLMIIALAALAVVLRLWMPMESFSASPARTVIPVSFDLDLYPHENRHIGPVTGSTRFLQSFISPVDELAGLEIFVSTFRSRIRTPYTLILFDSTGSALRTVPLDIRAISDNAFFPVVFDPVPDALEKEYSFTIVPARDSVSTPITLQLSGPAPHRIGSLILNGEHRSESVVFRPIASVERSVLHLPSFFRSIAIPFAMATLAATHIAYRIGGYRALYVLIGFVCIYHTFAHPPFSILDEGAHFDFVNALLKDRVLPVITDPVDAAEMERFAAEAGTPHFMLDGSTPRYEGVQPPLYYLVGAVVAWSISLFTDSVAVRFYGLRLMSIPFLVLTALLLKKTCDVLVANGTIRRDEFLFFSLGTLFLLSPAVVFVLGPLTNDQLLVPLATLFFYLIISRLFQEEGTKAEPLLLALVAAAMILTKLTAAYLTVLGLFVLLIRRGFGAAVIYAGLSGLIVFPWFLHNRSRYGAWTGIEEHLAFVRPIANPDSVAIPITHILSRLPEFFTGYLFLPVVHPMPVLGVHFTAVVLMMVFAFHVGAGAVDLWNGPAAGEHHWMRIRAVLLASVVLNYVYLIFGTLATEVWAVFPRYMYLNVCAVFLLTFVFVQRVIAENHVRTVSAAIFGIWSLSLLHYFDKLA